VPASIPAKAAARSARIICQKEQIAVADVFVSGRQVAAEEQGFPIADHGVSEGIEKREQESVGAAEGQFYT
jgi:hypothetical protein